MTMTDGLRTLRAGWIGARDLVADGAMALLRVIATCLIAITFVFALVVAFVVTSLDLLASRKPKGLPRSETDYK